MCALKLAKAIYDEVVSDIDIPGKSISDTLLLVAMSGGVDSSAIAALLSLSGYRVIGVTMNLYSSGSSCSSKSCCGSRDISDARRVAAMFNFPHYVVDYRERFKKGVISHFLDEYSKGRTPVPCVSCNMTVKFDDLLNLARNIGADALVTGHYVKRKMVNGYPVMLMAEDQAKDQSYFLSFTTKEQLEFVRFPLGGFSKTKTRLMAQEIGVPVYDKPDSQDICFVGDGDYRDFIDKKPGDMVDLLDNVVGGHDGTHNFTIGQRRGIGVSGDEPMYVAAIDVHANKVTIGPRSALLSKGVIIDEINWIVPVASDDYVEVRLRSSNTPIFAKLLQVEGSSAMLEFSEPQFAVTPGQVCAMYKGDMVLGGGFIKESILKNH